MSSNIPTCSNIDCIRPRDWLVTKRKYSQKCLICNCTQASVNLVTNILTYAPARLVDKTLEFQQNILLEYCETFTASTVAYIPLPLYKQLEELYSKYKIYGHFNYIFYKETGYDLGSQYNI